MNAALSTYRAAALLALVVTVWGASWPVTKLIVQDAPPLWTSAMRCAIAAAALAPILWAKGSFAVPRRSDWPVVLSASILHMGAFSALVAIGLQYVSASRAIVLGYTTPLWVAVGAHFFLAEHVTPRRAAGVALGLGGLAVLFNPLHSAWSSPDAILGNSLLLVAAFCWSINIVFLRAHQGISSPLLLCFWQAVLTAGGLACLAWLLEGLPDIRWTWRLSGLLLFSGIVCTAVAQWAIITVNRSVPAITTSLGLLATPVIGIAVSVAILREQPDASLLIAVAMILGGIAFGATSAVSFSRLSVKPSA